jgi:hypothetical protein
MLSRQNDLAPFFSTTLFQILQQKKLKISLELKKKFAGNVIKLISSVTAREIKLECLSLE